MSRCWFPGWVTGLSTRIPAVARGTARSECGGFRVSRRTRARCKVCAHAGRPRMRWERETLRADRERRPHEGGRSRCFLAISIVPIRQFSMRVERAHRIEFSAAVNSLVACICVEGRMREFALILSEPQTSRIYNRGEVCRTRGGAPKWTASRRCGLPGRPCWLVRGSNLPFIPSRIPNRRCPISISLEQQSSLENGLRNVRSARHNLPRRLCECAERTQFW